MVRREIRGPRTSKLRKQTAIKTNSSDQEQLLTFTSTLTCDINTHSHLHWQSENTLESGRILGHLANSNTKSSSLFLSHIVSFAAKYENSFLPYFFTSFYLSPFVIVWRGIVQKWRWSVCVADRWLSWTVSLFSSILMSILTLLPILLPFLFECLHAFHSLFLQEREEKQDSRPLFKTE